MPYVREYTRLCKELANKLTVEEVIKVIDPGLRHGRERSGHNRLPSSWRNFMDKLLGLGMTQIDWPALPNSSITTRKLRQLGKEKIRILSVLVLGTLSSRAMDALVVREPGQEIEGFTVEALLNTNPCVDGRWGYNSFTRMYSRSFLNTRQKLRELGFRYEDGLFMRMGTKRQLAENLRAKEGLSWRMALRMAGIAEKRGWVAGFLD